MANPGELLRKVRLRHGVSQKSLAMRASTTRTTIARIERNWVSPSVETMQELLFLLGEDLVLDVKTREIDIDRNALRERLRLSPEERLRRTLAESGRIGERRSADQVVDEYIAIADEQCRVTEAADPE